MAVLNNVNAVTLVGLSFGFEMSHVRSEHLFLVNVIKYSKQLCLRLTQEWFPSEFSYSRITRSRYKHYHRKKHYCFSIIFHSKSFVSWIFIKKNSFIFTCIQTCWDCVESPYLMLRLDHGVCRRVERLRLSPATDT